MAAFAEGGLGAALAPRLQLVRVVEREAHDPRRDALLVAVDLADLDLGSRRRLPPFFSLEKPDQVSDDERLCLIGRTKPIFCSVCVGSALQCGADARTSIRESRAILCSVCVGSALQCDADARTAIRKSRVILRSVCVGSALRVRPGSTSSTPRSLPRSRPHMQKPRMNALCHAELARDLFSVRVRSGLP
jgi:hypothetical protein